MSDSEREVVFRNYKPKGAKLAAHTVDATATVSSEVRAQLEESVQSKISDENDALVILPTDEAADLRRILDPRLRILERRTQEAIVELIKQKMAAEISGAGVESMLHHIPQLGLALARAVVVLRQLVDARNAGPRAPAQWFKVRGRW